MVEWLADVDLGEPPSDEEKAQSQFGTGWAEEAARAEAEAHQDFVRAQFFTFQISTFDKSGFPRAFIIAWKSHHSPYPLVLLPPLRLTHQDEHGQEQNVLNSTVVFQSCPKTTTTN